MTTITMATPITNTLVPKIAAPRTMKATPHTVATISPSQLGLRTLPHSPTRQDVLGSLSPHIFR
jgi:hypothetical protein